MWIFSGGVRLTLNKQIHPLGNKTILFISNNGICVDSVGLNKVMGLRSWRESPPM